jgi:hypothetical protein
MVLGYGCSGGGVRLIDAHYWGFKSIMDEEELREHIPQYAPSPSFVFEENQIKIGFSRGRGNRVSSSHDITTLLENNGVKIPETIERAKKFVYIR